MAGESLGIAEVEDARLSAKLGIVPSGLAPSVVDADALLSSVQNQCRTGWQSRLSQIAEAQHSMAFASRHVLREVHHGFPKMATGGLSVEDLSDCFERHYLPHIAWVDVADTGEDDERVSAVAAIDSTDAPTARLACLIAPAVVFSSDKSLTDTGFSSKRWRDLALSVVQAGEGETQQEAVTLAVALPTYGAIMGAAGLSRAVRLPSWLGPLLLTGGIAWTLTDRERRATIARVLEPMVQSAGDFYERQRAATAVIATAAIGPAADQSVKQSVAALLARSTEPLLARDIADRIDRRAPVRAEELRTMLAEEPEFTRVGYRWQLGELLPVS